MRAIEITRSELPGGGEPQEVHTDDQHELYGDFEGHAAAHGQIQR